jgi:hypothetical protein
MEVGRRGGSVELDYRTDGCVLNQPWGRIFGTDVPNLIVAIWRSRVSAGQERWTNIEKQQKGTRTLVPKF